MEKQALIDKLAPESMALFLTKLLKMRISIADSEAILTEICNALASGFKDVEIIETLICRLRPHTIDIEINPEYLRQISECSQQVTVLPVWSEDASQKIRDTFSLFSDGMFYEMGIRVPAIRFIPNYKFAENTFALRINHLRSHPLQGLRISQILVNESPQYLAEFGIQTAIPLRNPSNNRDNSLVEAEQRANLEDQGIFTWDAIGYIVLVLANEIRHAAGCLVDSEGVEYDMAMIDQAFPQLVAAAMEIYSTAQLAGVFRGLLMEGLPIRDMRSILERLLHYDYAFSDDPSKYIFFGDRLVLHQAFQSEEIFGLNNLIQYARSGLKEYISHKYTYGRGQSRLNVYLLDSELEKRLVEHVTHSGDHDTQKLLTPEAVEMIFQELRSMLSPLPPPTKMPVILTTTSIRFFLRDLLAPEFPELQVLAFEELSPLTEITPIDKISIAA
ncbi:MAG: FHIPEP family type III secretion protein [Gammaproteobacteria bacterium]